MKLKILSVPFLALLLAVAFFLVTGTHQAQGAGYSLHVNAGSSADYTSPDDKIFLADRAWTAGTWGFIGGEQKEVSGFELYATGGIEPEIEPVFATQRQAWTEFRVSNIPNDTYLLTLYFREERAHGPGINRFSLTAENQLLDSDLDIYAHVGRDYGLVRQFAIDVSDGELNLTAQVIEGVTNISAISLKQTTNGGNPPGDPKAAVAQGSYDGVQVDWQSVSAGDLDGYHIYRSVDGGAFTRLTNELVYITRYQDRTATGTNSYSYQISAVDIFGLEGNRSVVATASPLPVGASPLPFLQLTIDPQDWEFMYAFPFDSNSVDGQLLYNGETYDVTVRYRGAGSRLTNKKNWKIKFEGEPPTPGRDTFNLNADNMDFTYLRGPLSYQMMGSAGIDTATHRFVNMSVNGIYMGVYNDYEQIDENFMARTGRDQDTTIFKAKNSLFKQLNSAAAYESAYEKNNNSGTGHTEMIELIDGLGNASDDLFPWLLQDRFDIKTYLDIHAFAVWTGQLDAFDGNNYLLHNRDTDRWEMIPWDYDFAFGNNPSHFGFVNNANIDLGMDVDRILPKRGVNVPQYRHYFCTKLQEYSNTLLTPAAVSGAVANMQAQMLADARRDWLKVGWEDSGQLTTLPADFANYAATRKAKLDGQIPGYCNSFNRPYLEINEVAPSESADWIEIYNESLLPIDLNGFYLSDSPTNLTKHKISGSLIVPPLGHVVFTADGQPGVTHVGFSLADSAGSVYLADTAGNLLDTLSWSAISGGESVARLPDGTETVETFTGPTKGFANRKGPPLISDVTHSPAVPGPSDSVAFTASVTDDGPFDVVLNYQINGSGFVTVPMTTANNLTWTATIGPRPDGTRIQYFVSATDKDGATGTGPLSAPDSAFDYIVGYESPTLFINELMAANSNSFTDPDEPNETPDYIEIYNPGPWAINLADMYATDDLTRPQKYRLAQRTDQLVVEAGGFLILIADDDGTQGDNHLGFKLSKGGEDFGLFDRADLGNGQIDGTTFAKQTTDVAIGRCQDGAAWQTLASSSPGRSNAGCGLAAPKLSGFSQSPKWPIASSGVPVMIQITAEDDGSLAAVELNYRFENGAWSTVSMAKSGDNYSFQIPNIANVLIIEYYIEATDDDGLKTTYPFGAPERLKRYKYHTSQPAQFPESAVPPRLIINELVANGVLNGIDDPAEFGEKSAWIEIFNGESVDVDLGGYKLAHELFFPREYVIPAGVIAPANGYLVFYLDDDPEQGGQHAAFKPIRQGDTLGLYTAEDIPVDEVTYGSELQNGAVLARLADSPQPTMQVLTCGTPGEENQAECVVDPTQTFLPFVIR